MKLNEYIRKKQIDSGLSPKAFSEMHDISQAQYYRYINEGYMNGITPLIASKICKSFHMDPSKLYEFDDSFSKDFVDKVEEYLDHDNYLMYPYSNIKRFYENYLISYGFTEIDYDVTEVVRNDSYVIYKGKEKLEMRTPSLRFQPYRIFPVAITKHSNGKEYIVLFFEPKHIDANTTIYDSKFHAVHTFLIWAVAQMSRKDHAYDNNFIFLTTSDFIFDNITGKDSSLNGFQTNEGTDIYFGLCRKNRPYQCKKITNLQNSDTVFI
jgi:hypothetical protein